MRLKDPFLRGTYSSPVPLSKRSWQAFYFIFLLAGRGGSGQPSQGGDDEGGSLVRILLTLCPQAVHVQRYTG